MFYLKECVYAQQFSKKGWTNKFGMTASRGQVVEFRRLLAFAYDRFLVLPLENQCNSLCN